jgi:tol-pal system protein YbgF
MSIHLTSIPLSRKPLLLAGLLLAAATLTPSPAFAANKDIIQLQVQVQQLQDAVARLQQSNDERMGVVKDLVQQSADSVNKMSAATDSIQLLMKNQQETEGGKMDQLSGQIQSLNDSLDELKARLGNIEKTLQDVQSQQQSISAGLPPAAAGTGPAVTPAPDANLPATPPTTRHGKPSAAIPMAEAPAVAADTPAAPPADDLYKTALGDYMAAKYTLASSEFGDVIKNYPDNPLSGNAFYYQAEIEYRAGRYTQAITAYDSVIVKYPASNKVPVSRLHKGEALIALKQKDAGIHELRLLIQRFPNSPEAMQARSRLSGMGVTVTAKR